MTTYVTMRNRIADELLDSGALTNAQINNAILTAIKHYERKEWWFNQKVGTFSTVANQELYTSSDLTDIPDIVLIQSMLIGASSTTKKPPPRVGRGLRQQGYFTVRVPFMPAA